MFIESVRARATCNTIISSHPISSHRPCTNSSLLSPRVSSPFPSWFFFYSSSTRSLPPPILIYFYFPFHIIKFASSHPHSSTFSYYNRVSDSDLGFLLVSVYSLYFFPSVSPFLLFFPSTVVILLPSRVYSYFFHTSPIESPLSYPQSCSRCPFNPISSWRRLAETVTQPSPIFSLRPV